MKILGSKKVWVQKYFGSEKNVGAKEIFGVNKSTHQILTPFSA